MPRAADQPIEDPAGALEPFYRALDEARRGRPGAIVRVTMFGDSITASGWIPARLRGRLTPFFGDAGAGFVYAAEPTRWYADGEVLHHAKRWRVRSIVGSRSPDRLYGLGGAAFDAADRRATATFATTSAGAGDRVSRFEIHYLEQPGGGGLVIKLDGTTRDRLSTAGPRKQLAVRRLEVPEGPHRLTLSVAGDGPVRLFGVVLERDGPGLVVENLGLVSSSAPALAGIRADHWRDALRARAPGLVIVFLGANDVQALAGAQAPANALLGWETSFANLLQSARAARPGAACLVLSPLARGSRRLRDVLPRLVQAQRRVALANGCAFFDSFAWMGGPDGLRRWRRDGLLRRDLVHPTKLGSEGLADAVADALLSGYARRRQAATITLPVLPPSGDW